MDGSSSEGLGLDEGSVLLPDAMGAEMKGSSFEGLGWLVSSGGVLLLLPDAMGDDVKGSSGNIGGLGFERPGAKVSRIGDDEGIELRTCEGRGLEG
jgi:hypothetical protein